MVTADVEELKTKLAEYLTKVKAGQDLVITEAGRPMARTMLVQLFATAQEIDPNLAIRHEAERLLASYPLRAADVLQLAAALAWAAGQPAGHGFVCLDQRLRAAAQAEGFALLRSIL